MPDRLAKQLLNHKSSGATGRYTDQSLEQLRPVMERVEDEMLGYAPGTQEATEEGSRMMLARAAKKVMSPEELQRLLGQEFLMPVEQAALYLCVSVSTLNHWRSDGKGPKFVKLCGSSRGAIRYRLGDLRTFVESNTFESVAEAELADAMSRVSDFWDDWGKTHPLVAKGPHFLVDSALADRDTYLGVFLDPYAKVVWLKPERR